MTDDDLRGFYRRYITPLDSHEIDRMDEFVADEVMQNAYLVTRGCQHVHPGEVMAGRPSDRRFVRDRRVRDLPGPRRAFRPDDQPA